MKSNNFFNNALLICAYLFLPSLFLAQTYKQEAETVMQPLDKTILTTNILYDRIFPLAHIQDYKGDAVSDTTNTEHFHQAYYEIFSSMSNTASYQSPETFNNSLIANNTNNDHSIGIMLFNYNYLDPEAISSNKIFSQNGQLYDTPNRSGSPFRESTFFVATPLLPAEAEIWQGEHYFTFDPTHFITNTSKQVQSISIDFDDGYGLQQIYDANSIQTKGTQSRGFFSGIARFFSKTSFFVRVIVVLTDGQTYQSISKVIAKPVATAKTIIQGCNGGDVIDIVGLPFDASAFGRGTEMATGKAYIFYSNTNCATHTITKPVVFLDGFDPTNDRDAQKIYDDYINVEVNSNGSIVKLGDKLRAEGYDIIVYNYADGGDLIEKNALAVVKLLQQLYGAHSSTIQEEFVLIGPSMGALVAQYALAYAEKNNINVHTRLYISFDGPHQGANAPLGLQQTIDYLFQKGISSAVFKKMRDGLHRVPAAKEMIVHHSDTNSETPQPDNFRNIFLSNLNSVDKYPTNIRKVAIVNGSRNLAPNQYLSQGGEMLYIQVKRAGLLGLVQGKLGDRIRMEISAGANNSTVKSADIWLFSPLLNLFLWRGPQYTKYIQPAGNNFSYDTSVGSYFTDPIVPDSKTEAWISLGQTILYLFGGNKSIFRHNINPTFMPTTSSIDLQSTSFTLGYNFNNENIICTGKTPFDRVYAPLNNQPHVKITAENALWFESEILGNPTPQPGGAGNISIEGDDNFCEHQGPIVLSIRAIKGNPQYNWTCSPNLQIISGQGSNSITIEPTAGATGNGSVYLSMSSSCISSIPSLYKNIYITPSIIGFSFTGSNPGNPANGEYLSASVEDLPGASAYLWYIDSNYYETTNIPSFSTGNWLCGDHKLGVKAITTCGTTDLYEEYYWGLCSQSYKIYPNPASQQITIEQISSSQGKGKVSLSGIWKSFDVKIFGEKGKLITEQTSDRQKSITIPTMFYDNGTYYLHIIQGKETVKKQIIIKH